MMQSFAAGSVKTFGGSGTGKSWRRGIINGNQNCVTRHGVIMIPAAISLLTFDMVPLYQAKWRKSVKF